MATGCASVAVDNALPGATLENVRFETDDGDALWLHTDRLLPGGSASVSVPFRSDAARASGHLRFELVVDGRRVELVTTEPVTLAAEGETRIVIDPDTAVRSDLPSARAPSAGGPSDGGGAG
jgi:hypothetical protein